MYLKKGSAGIFSLEVNDYVANEWSNLFSMLMYILHGIFPSIKA